MLWGGRTTVGFKESLMFSFITWVVGTWVFGSLVLLLRVTYAINRILSQNTPTPLTLNRSFGLSLATPLSLAEPLMLCVSST